MPLTVEVVSPEAILFTGDAEMVIARTLEGGDIAFQPGHVSFLGALDHWPLRVLQEEGQLTFAVHGGFVEVSNDRVTVLSDVAEPANAIDVARAEAAFEKADHAMKADPEDLEAAAAVRRAHVRLEVARAGS